MVWFKIIGQQEIERIDGMRSRREWIQKRCLRLWRRCAAPGGLPLCGRQPGTGNGGAFSGTPCLSQALYKKEIRQELAVLLLEKRANLDEPSPADIVYANEYELGAEKTFSFQAVLPKADLQQYVLKIGGENGLLYQRVLDGSEIPDTPDTTTSASSTVPTTGSDAQETSGSSVTSGTSAGTQPSGTDPDTGVPSSPSAPDGSGDSAQTGDTYPIVWGVAAVAALLVLGTVVILKKKEENRHA